MNIISLMSKNMDLIFNKSIVEKINEYKEDIDLTFSAIKKI